MTHLRPLTGLALIASLLGLGGCGSVTGTPEPVAASWTDARLAEEGAGSAPAFVPLRQVSAAERNEMQTAADRLIVVGATVRAAAARDAAALADLPEMTAYAASQRDLAKPPPAPN